jgi:hypothetical protein
MWTEGAAAVDTAAAGLAVPSRTDLRRALNAPSPLPTVAGPFLSKPQNLSEGRP